MDSSDGAAEAQQAAASEVRDKLLEPFILALCQTLREMVNIEPVVRSVDCRPFEALPARLTAVLGLGSAIQGFLLLTVSEQMASAVTLKVLEGIADDLDESVIRDCIGEIANVVAGQAKALLAETPFQVALSMPKVVANPAPELGQTQELDCQTVSFSSDLGELTMQLVSRRAPGEGSVVGAAR